MAPRRLLLVGEGNFSFAAALSETLNASTRVTATCLQSPAELARDPVARENLQRLRERGTEVRFGVDCTQLADAFEPHHREFDRIYFNFPHCGRKAGVAKNRELLAKFFQRGFLEAPSCHPIKTINEKLIAELGKAFPLKRLKCSFPLLPERSTSVLTSWNCDSLSAAFWISLCEDNSNSESLTDGTTQDMEDFLVLFSEFSLKDPGRDSREEAHEGIYGQTKVCLRPSLLAHAQTVIQAPDFLPGSLHVLSGPVFQKCPILPFTMPAFHETLFILGFNKNLRDDYFQSLLDHLKGTLDSLLTQTLLEGSKLSRSVEFIFQSNEKDYIIKVKSHNFGSDCAKDLIIGSVTTSATSIIHKDQCFMFVSMNLDLLAMLVWGISDWRMLWTFDHRFLKNFVPGKIEPFKSYSLYPPCYVHDISFWLDEKKEFDELEFHTVARAVSQDTVISIQFLSRFQHPKTQQVSLCYRLTYQTCDKALTQHQVGSMQSQFRKEIQQRLHVIPR
ncbi:ferredoxin-fold anticodon-binding domain-containing protein 1 isoform X3 [Ailuropoda melanoleuca]|uniref:ferredoxin-fold anticodon-binding domain-containing protein 1 isoform X3 n=1 Tax=Ailuropoda melanoleuca TaxID=9646 RepID=UPI001494EE26|nr:ferredoxin-fold anticodon-binding domain-containing protein 1 isoform X3 [Ailuropoda melanoleuca]